MVSRFKSTGCKKACLAKKYKLYSVIVLIYAICLCRNSCLSTGFNKNYWVISLNLHIGFKQTTFKRAQWKLFLQKCKRSYFNIKYISILTTHFKISRISFNKGRTRETWDCNLQNRHRKIKKTRPPTKPVQFTFPGEPFTFSECTIFMSLPPHPFFLLFFRITEENIAAEYWQVWQSESNRQCISKITW